MSKITLAGDSIIVTSALKLEDIRTVQKYRPAALSLMGGKNEDEVIFRLAATNGAGSINVNGACFGSETRDENKFATLTMPCKVTGDIATVKAHIADTLGAAIASLNKLEEKLPAVVAEIRAERQTVMDGITII